MGWRQSKTFISLSLSCLPLLSLLLLLILTSGHPITMSLSFVSVSTPSKTQGTITGEIQKLSAHISVPASAMLSATKLVGIKNSPLPGEGVSQALHARFTAGTSL